MKMNLLKKATHNIKAPRELMYKIYAKLGRTMPHGVAALIAYRNSNRLSNRIVVQTYDGSAQCVHPTVCEFQGKRYLACTPYPYGLEWYENPCIYQWDVSTQRYQPVKGSFPVVLPQTHGEEHYSDPCLAVKGDMLHLVFRKCERHDGIKEDLLLCTSSYDGDVWSSPEKIICGAGDSLISPAVTDNHIFCVNYSTGGYTSELEDYPWKADMQLGEKKTCTVSGLPEGYYIWHIDVAATADGYIGLFLLKKCQNDFVGKLALFRTQQIPTEWVYECDVMLTEEEQAAIQFVYKSALILSEQKVLCSAMDKKRRYFLFEQEIVRRSKG